MSHQNTAAMLTFVLSLASLNTEEELEARGKQLTQEDAFAKLNELIEEARQVTKPAPADAGGEAQSYYEPWAPGMGDGASVSIHDAHATPILLVAPRGDDIGAAFPGENQMDYAARVTSCVNACTGIPISAPMVLALLDGRKTQTRRIIKPQPQLGDHSADGHRGEPWWAWIKNPLSYANERAHYWKDGTEPGMEGECPFGSIGDRLWVKETWRPQVAHSHGMDTCDCGDLDITYCADKQVKHFNDGTFPDEWTLPKIASSGNVSPLFMPRWASRITLEITDVRVQRLREITDQDAVAEGLMRLDPGQVVGNRVANDSDWPSFGLPEWTTEMFPSTRKCPSRWNRSAVSAFRVLWESINGKDAWQEDPWVWALTFKQVDP